MKNLILVLILLIFPKLLLAQEVFIDSANKEYLSLGSTQDNKQNFMDLKTGAIDWIDKPKQNKCNRQICYHQQNFGINLPIIQSCFMAVAMNHFGMPK